MEHAALFPAPGSTSGEHEYHKATNRQQLRGVTAGLMQVRLERPAAGAAGQRPAVGGSTDGRPQQIEVGLI
jgi:hypothetical protein